MAGGGPMSRRLTKREKRERAAARRWVREALAKAADRRAELRAEEPALVREDEVWGEFHRVDRAIRRFAAKHALALVSFASDFACGEPDCRCLGCRARELDRQATATMRTLGELFADDAWRGERDAAEDRVRIKTELAINSARGKS